MASNRIDEPIAKSPFFDRSQKIMQIRFGISLIGTLLALILSICDTGASAVDWPQFRGPNGSGVAPKGRPPIKFGPTNNVRWCIDVPWSPSSPCVWGDRIFLTTFENVELQTHCYAARTGDLFWSRGIKPRKLEVFHSTDGSPAASTPVTGPNRQPSYSNPSRVIFIPSGMSVGRGASI